MGSYISGVGHLGLIGWLLVGDYTPEAAVLEVQSVSTISVSDFNALVRDRSDLEAVTQVVQPAVPEAAVASPSMRRQTDDPLKPPSDSGVSVPQTDTLPEISESIAPPMPSAEAQETAQDLAVLAPPAKTPSIQQPLDRIAPEPVAQPDPDTRIDPQKQPSVSAEAEGEATEAQPQQATAPEAAVPEVVLETALAPSSSMRPPGRRPVAPEPQAAAQPAIEPDDQTVVDDSDVMRALAAAQDAVSQPLGPPLSQGEKETLRVAVSACWNVGSLSSEAGRVTVVVGVSMNRDGTPIQGSIRLVSSSGGTQEAARKAFETARRAIIRCGSRGYNLPAEKFDQWKDIEMTFNPERMRVR
ncbi:MAG: energy transducer TonB [Pseudomonadota bacterium]